MAGTAKALRDKGLPEDKEIRAEYRRLMKLYENAPENHLNLAQKLVSRAAFMTIMLERMERDVVENGWEEDYQNGAHQSGKKETASAKLHISMLKNFAAVMRQLDEMLGGHDGDRDDDSEFF